jgi:hypothetical protein
MAPATFWTNGVRDSEGGYVCKQAQKWITGDNQPGNARAWKALKEKQNLDCSIYLNPERDRRHEDQSFLERILRGPMSDFGRLIRSRLKTSRSAVIHPIVDLLRTRLSPTSLPKPPPDSLDMQLFRSLPLFETNEIDAFADDFLKKPLCQIFAPHIHKFQWLPSNMLHVMSFLENEKSEHPHLIIVLFYFVLSFLINCRDCSDLVNSENLVLIMQALRLASQSSLWYVETFLFDEVLRLFVREPSFRWDMDSVAIVSKHLIENKKLDFAFSLTITELLTRLAIKPSEIVQPFLNALYVLIDERRACIRPEHYQKMNPALCEFLKPMNFQAMRILSLISCISAEQSTTDCFVLIGTLVIDYISKLPVLLTPSVPTGKPVVLPTVLLGHYKFYPDSLSAFERGFVGTVIPPALAFDQLLEGSPLLALLSNLV